MNEDIGTGDITAQIVPDGYIGKARITSKEKAIICGISWFNEVFFQLDPNVSICWFVKDGDTIEVDQPICEIIDNAGSLLTGERTALNFLQTLSGTAILSSFYCNLVGKGIVKLLDTRKALPGLRLAQKCAVRCGGCYSHRMGLHGAYLIKENHIASCGSIKSAVQQARALLPNKSIEVEVETLDELKQALDEHP